VADFKAVPMVEAEEPFGIVRSTATGVWVPIPGWQAIVAAEDPIALLGMSDQLPMESTDAIEPVLLVVDRADREWDVYSYFIIDQNGKLHIQWFEHEPADQSAVRLLGKVILIMRPKHVLDEDYIKERWQLDE
ncbi:MAG TPA: RuBisCO accumulation factor 1, partial [Chroococcidiopsis sp.]